jgi:hypothetical protein
MHPQNRLETARRYLSQFVEKDEPMLDTSEATLRRIVEATQSCFEHYLIARSTGPRERTPNRELIEKLSLSLTGAQTSDADANSVGRDTQFELFVRAMLTMGGVTVSIAEPDLRFPFGSEEFAIAVKRVKKISRLNQRFRDGAKQIEKSGIRGFVAVNTDLLIRDVGLDGQPAERGQNFDRRLELLHRLDDKYSSNPKIVGRIAFGTDTVWHLDRERPTAEFGFFRQIRVFPADDAEAQALTQFFDDVASRIDARMAGL